jgi:DNA-binding CsgD family transcriptional regulator
MALAGWISLLQGEGGLAWAYIENCRRAAGVVSKIPELAFVEGTYQLLVESDSESIHMLEQLLRELEREEGPPEQTAPIRLFWAIAAGFLGDRDTALAASAEHLDTATRLGPEWVISWAQWIAGLAQFRHGDSGNALALTRDSLRHQLAIGDRWGLVWGTYQIAWILAAELNSGHGRLDRPSRLDLTTADTIARILGGAARMSEWTGVRLGELGPFHAETTRAASGARRVLGEQIYLRAFEEGKGWETDQNLAYERILGLALGQSVSEPEPDPEPAESIAADLAAEELTRREHEVAALVAEGMSNPEIARKLFLSNRTVQTHVGNILNKRGFKNRQAIAVWYVRLNSPDLS